VNNNKLHRSYIAKARYIGGDWAISLQTLWAYTFNQLDVVSFKI